MCQVSFHPQAICKHPDRQMPAPHGAFLPGERCTLPGEMGRDRDHQRHGTSRVHPWNRRCPGPRTCHCPPRREAGGDLKRVTGTDSGQRDGLGYVWEVGSVCEGRMGCWGRRRLRNNFWISGCNPVVGIPCMETGGADGRTACRDPPCARPGVE